VRQIAAFHPTFSTGGKTNMQPILSQLERLLRSRKFWALIAALVTIAAGWSSGELNGWQAVQGVIAALAVYSTGVAIEDAGRSQEPHR
jgi:hypothetical protein